MKTSLHIENQIKKTNRVFDNLQDDVLDEYNKGEISLEEMKNIISWCKKMKKRLIERYEKGTDLL